MNEAPGIVLVCAVEGTALTGAERDFFARARPSGVTLFSRNIPENYREVALLTRALQDLRGSGAPPLLIAIDQEGGRVARIKAPGFPNRGPAMLLEGGRFDDSARAAIEAYGLDVGNALADLGINVNFAPVADILTEAANTAIGDRAFGTDVEPVCVRARAFLRGLERGGVAGCLKHFPGQGDARVDTHVGSAVVDLPVKVLNDRELVPFRAMLDDCRMVMVAHCIYPELDTLMASRSPRIIGGILRGEMGFDGVVVTDDMNMGAVPQAEDEWREAIVEAVAAGADMVLVCRHIDRCESAWQALSRAAQKSRAFAGRLEEAATRMLRLRGTLT